MRDKKGRFIKGYKPKWTEESRLKVSDSMKGVNTWSKGRKLSEEHKEKCRKNSSKYWLGKKRLNMTGKLHPNWKENKIAPSLIRSIRQSYKYKVWRKSILERDNHTCTKCSKTDNLDVDHYPIKFVDLIKKHKINTHEEAMDCKELWLSDNGRVLCKECHKKTPTYGNKNNNDIV